MNWKRLEAGVEDPPFLPDVCLIKLYFYKLSLYNSIYNGTCSVTAPCCICQGRIRHRTVFHCQRSEFRCYRWYILYKIQYRLSVYTVAKWSMFLMISGIYVFFECFFVLSNFILSTLRERYTHPLIKFKCMIIRVSHRHFVIF